MQGRTLNQLLRRLRALRAESGLTQEQFAEQAGLSYKYYQQVEAGRKPDLRLSTLERLARAYRVEVWQLLAPDERGFQRRKPEQRARRANPG